MCGPHKNGRHDLTLRPRAPGALLRARRAQLDPRECGLPETDSARRVAGLRREKVAQLAAISVDYYTRLEQGRVRASAPSSPPWPAPCASTTTSGITSTNSPATDARPRHRRPAQRTRPAMHRLLDQLTHTPTLFTDPAIRGMHQDGAHDSRAAVAALRMEAAADPDDLARLVGELTIQDADFRTWWAEQRDLRHQAVPPPFGGRPHPRLRHLGRPRRRRTTPDGPDRATRQPSHDALRILTSWTAERAEPGRAKDRTP